MAPVEKMKVPTIVGDYTALPLAIPLQPSFQQRANHYIYLRANAPKAPTVDTPREIFAVNIPIDATETHIRSLFAEQLGGARVEKVEFEGARVGKGITAQVAPVDTKGKKRKRGSDEAEAVEEVGLLPVTWERDMHRSGSTAVITFVDATSRDIALKETKRAAKAAKEIVWGKGTGGKVPALGSSRYLARHRLRYPDSIALQTSVDEFMTAFAAQEAVRAKAFARQRQEPDEDGFVTVTRGGRTGPARIDEAREKEEELKKREKSRIKEDFYRFQVREKRKEQANELVKGYEEDRRRVEEMKRRRGKFKPM